MLMQAAPTPHLAAVVQVMLMAVTASQLTPAGGKQAATLAPPGRKPVSCRM